MPPLANPLPLGPCSSLAHPLIHFHQFHEMLLSALDRNSFQWCANAFASSVVYLSILFFLEYICISACLVPNLHFLK
jgi:hypothetical protein